MIKEMIAGYTKADFETLHKDAKQRFEEVKHSWLEKLLWTTPARARHLLGTDRERITGYPIFDGTHLLAQRSFVAGFLEGNTSASRPWLRYVHPDKDRNRYAPNREFLDKVTDRALAHLSGSNFYHEAGQFYYDFGGVDTGAHVIKRRGKSVHFYTLYPGSYFIINNAFGDVEILVREFSLTAKALVNRYGKKKDGMYDWSTFSQKVKELYNRTDTITKIECVEIYLRNKDFNPGVALGGSNRQWTSVVYETGVYSASGFNNQNYEPSDRKDPKYLEISYYRRRPFVIGKAQGELYGEKGPTTDSIGLIRSLNKKAVSKDIAIEKMLDPTTQGPASIRKSYLTTQARRHIPLDATAAAQGGMKTVYEIPMGLNALVMDVEDMRRQVEKFYYADFLLFLSNNPKTRTATEAQGVMDEQKSVIGPNLQSLNKTYNTIIAEYMLDFVVENDEYIGEIPEDLQGAWIETEFTSPFAQAQKAFDLPQINQFVAQWSQIAQLIPSAWNNININKLAQIYEDRYQLPAGLNNPATEVEAMMKQAQEQQLRMQQMEALPKAASAAKSMAEAKILSQEGNQDAGSAVV
jgi:hypothetical protein